jgi:Ca-activated chloride channel family protein
MTSRTFYDFQHPWVLLLLALIPVFLFLLGRRGKGSSLLLSSLEVVKTVRRTFRTRAGFLAWLPRAAAIALFIVTLAGPRRVNDEVENLASGVDILLVVDMSWSMMALDMGAPGETITRWDIAQSVVKDFISRRPSDRIGLVAFSGVPYLVSPLTLNHAFLQEKMDDLHIGIIRELGTAIGDATAMAVRRIKNTRQTKSRLIILLTDGDNNKGELDPLPAAEVAAALGSRLYTIGIGKDRPVYLPAFDVTTGKLKRDGFGEVIETRTLLQPANYDVLDQMSQLANGRSYRATNRQELMSIYDDIDRLERTDVKLRVHRNFTPLFQWPLAAGLLLLLVDIALAQTVFRRVP